MLSNKSTEMIDFAYGILRHREYVEVVDTRMLFQVQERFPDSDRVFAHNVIELKVCETIFTCSK